MVETIKGMEFRDESNWNIFLRKFTIKEINAIRAKGVMMEDIKEYTVNFLNMKQVGVYSTPSNSFGYYEAYYENADGDRLAWANARVGIPTLTVSLVSETTWATLKHQLISKGLVRSSEPRQKRRTS